MKIFSIFIGIFMILFFVTGIHSAQAQGDLRGFDGKWLKLIVKPQKGLEFASFDSTTAPQKMKVSAYKIYACMDVEDSNTANESAFLRFFGQDGKPIGYGWLTWETGTNLDFLGYLDATIATNVTYTPGADGFPSMYSVTDSNLYGYVSVNGSSIEKIKIQSVSGEGYIEAPDTTETIGTYAVFGYTLKGGFTKDKKIPTPTPACGAIVFNESSRQMKP